MVVVENNVARVEAKPVGIEVVVHDHDDYGDGRGLSVLWKADGTQEILPPLRVK